MEKEKREKIYTEAVNLWGAKAQIEMALEESIELALACRKFLRNFNEETTKNLASEMADVEIMLEQLKLILPELKEISESEKQRKLERLEQRIIDNKFN